MSLAFPPSHCPACGHRLSPFDNIPVFSYLYLRGRCRYCGSRISLRYPLVELLSGFLVLLLYKKTGFTLDLLFYLPFVLCLVALSFIDLDTRRLPDILTLPLTVVGFSLSFLPGTISPLESFLGAISGFLLMYIVALFGKALFKKDALGGGDIKLMAAIGSFLGTRGILFTLFAASIAGSLIGIWLMRRKKDHIVPFGPFLSFGAFIYLFAGKFILNFLGF